MSLHIAAKPGEIANTVFITGDPLRAKHYAETRLERPSCYNQVRGMLGYTGVYKGNKISIQGTGIGIPSTALYLHELIHSYKVNCVIRLGTCGAIQPHLELGELILATEAYTDSCAILSFTDSVASPPTPSVRMKFFAEKVAAQHSIPLNAGPVFSTDLFYSEDAHRYNKYIHKNVLGVDMETSMLYAMASHYQIESLSLLTVSDNIITGAASSTDEREKRADEMIGLALEVVAQKNEIQKDSFLKTPMK